MHHVRYVVGSARLQANTVPGVEPKHSLFRIRTSGIDDEPVVELPSDDPVSLGIPAKHKGDNSKFSSLSIAVEGPQDSSNLPLSHSTDDMCYALALAPADTTPPPRQIVQSGAGRPQSASPIGALSKRKNRRSLFAVASAAFSTLTRRGTARALWLRLMHVQGEIDFL